MADEPLRPDAIVVRGGEMALETLQIALQTSYVEDDEYALSFFGDNGLTVVQIIAEARRTHPGCLENKKVRLSTVGRLADGGFAIERDGPFPHLAIRFPVYPTDETLEALREAFRPAIANPLVVDVS